MRMRKLRVIAVVGPLLVLFCGEPPTGVIENPVVKSDICEGCSEPGTSQGKDLKQLIAEGRVTDARKALCEYTEKGKKKPDCLKTIVEDDTKKNDVALNQMVVVLDAIILLQKVNDAINKAASLSGVLGSPKLLPLQAGDTCNLNAVETVLSFIGLDKEIVKQYGREIDGAVKNIENNPDAKKIKLVLSFSVNLGSETEKPLLQATFKDVVIDYDEVVIVGAVANLLLAVFKVIESHDFGVDIGKVLQNASELLDDLKSDFIGLIRRIPKTLDLNTCTNFLKFEKGGGDIWKTIPDDLSTALSRFKNGVEFLFSKENWCGEKEKDLVCFFDGNKDGEIAGYGKLSDEQKENAGTTCKGGQADCLLFNLESGAQMLGEPVDGYIIVSDQFNPVTFTALLGKFSQRTDCSQTDNILEVKDASDILKQFGFIDYDIPNFARIDVCKFFGRKNAEPKSLRDTVFPIEINTYDGFSFQFEIEVPEGTTQIATFSADTTRYYPEYPLEEWVSEGKIIIYTPVSISFSEATTSVLTIETTADSVKVTAPKGVTYEEIQSDATKVVLPLEFVKPYIRNGDTKHFENTEKSSKNRKIEKDFAAPLTDILTSKGYKYPDDIFTLSTDDISKTLSYIGNTFIMYTAMKDPSFNGSLDICPVIDEISNQAKVRKDKGKINDTQKSEIDKIVENIKTRYPCTSPQFKNSEQQLLSDLMAHLQFLAALAEVFSPEAMPQM